MRSAVKKRWVEALRSGEYKQCKDKLHNGKGFCCLGVLIDTEYDGDWIYGRQGDSDDFEWAPDCCPGAYAGANNMMLNSLTGGCDVYDQLADMNDRGCTLSTIADFIEAEL